MANNKIQIKRSTSNATVTGLSNGELAFTQAGNVFFIGAPDGSSGSIRIGGLMVPGTLTANQALVSNATSGIDKIITANAAITSIWANGTSGATGDLLYSNGTGIYWASAGQVGVNVNATYSWTNVHSFSANVNANTVNATAFTTSGVTVNTSGVYTTETVNGATLSVGTSFIANTTRLVIGTGVGLQANGGIGSAGQQLYSNGTTVYWADPAGDITAVTAGSGLTGGGTTGAVTLDVGSGNGISVSADAIAVLGGSTLTVNSTGAHVNSTLSITSLVTTGDVTVNGNTKLGDASSDVVSFVASVNSNIIPSANTTYDLGSATLRWNNVHSNNVLANFGSFSGNVTIGGDLTVTGNVTTVNVSSLSVNDPLIKLAVNNTTGDTLYIGFTGHYNGFGNTTNHTGLFREPSNKNYYLFSTYGDEAKVGNNEIIITDPSFSLANLTTYLLSGGLVTNATAVAITANSTVSVALVANTLSLSTALPATSGGTGWGSYTAGDLLFASNTSYLSKLALGTSGYVLQSNGSSIVYDTLDGGTF